MVQLTFRPDKTNQNQQQSMAQLTFQPDKTNPDQRQQDHPCSNLNPPLTHPPL